MKKLIWVPLVFWAMALSAAESIYSLTDFTGGMVDVVCSDKMQDKYSPDMLNVMTDEYNMITKRRGYTKYNATALAGTLNIKSMYVFDNVSNLNSYLIVNSSNSCYYSVGDGTFNTITSTLTLTAKDSYTVGKGRLYRDNEVDGLGGYWDASAYTSVTVANSTGMVSGSYICYFNNRLFKAKKNSSVVYFSEVNDPENFGLGTNYININTNDGDKITAVFRWGDRLLVTKQRSTYEIVESQAGFFVVRCLSSKIGCLYGDTADELNGLPIWLSHRGVERYNGSNFDLISYPIDNYVKALKQLYTSISEWNQDSVADWNLGVSASYVNVDTYTYTGSVAQKNTLYTSTTTTSYFSTSASDYTKSDFLHERTGFAKKRIQTTQSASMNATQTQFYIKNGLGYYTTFYVSTSFDVGQISLYLKRHDNTVLTANTTFFVYIADSKVPPFTYISSGAVYMNDFQKFDQPYEYWVNLTTVTLTAGTTYAVVIATNTGYTSDVVSLMAYGEGSLYGNLWKYSSGSWGSTPERYCFYSHIRSTYSTTSITLTASGGWDSGNYYMRWSYMNSTATVPSGCTIDYTLGVSSWAYAPSLVYNTIYPNVKFNYTGRYGLVKCVLTRPTDIDELYLSTVTYSGISDTLYVSTINYCTNWSNWYKLSTNDTIPSDTAITYYIKTSTASDNFSTKTMTAIGSGGVITGIVGPYIQIFASMTSTNLTGAVPMVNSTKVQWITTLNNMPVGKVYKDRYYLFVSTGSDDYNNIALVYQKDGSWTMYSGIKAGAAALYRNYLYTGASNNTGYVYLQDTGYSDDGSAISAYWSSRVLDLGNPICEKVFKTLWLTAENTGNWNVATSYRLHGKSTAFTDINYSVYGDGIISAKIPLQQAQKSRYIQFRFGNSNLNESFGIKRLELIYEILPPR